MNTIQKNKDTAYVNQTNRSCCAANKPAASKDLGMLSEKKWYDVSIFQLLAMAHDQYSRVLGGPGHERLKWRGVVQERN